MFSFFNKKSIPNMPAGKHAGNGFSLSPALRLIAFSLAIAMALSFAIAYFVHKKFVVDVRQAQLQDLTRHHANLTADNVRAWVTSQQTELLTFVEKPLIRDILINKDSTDLPDIAAQLKKNLDGIIAVRLFRPGEADLDTKSYPPVRYSELAMIGSALKGKVVPPELAKINQDWLLTFVLAVPDKKAGIVANRQFREKGSGAEKPDTGGIEKVNVNTEVAKSEESTKPEESIESEESTKNNAPRPLGVVVVTFDVKQLRQSLQRNSAGKTKVSLSQQVNDANSVKVLNVGDGGGRAFASSKIADTWWTIEVEAAPELVGETVIQSTLIYSILAALAFVLHYVAFLIARLLGKKITATGKNSSSVTKSIGALVSAGVKTRDDSMIDPLYQKKDILDIAIKETDEDLLGLEEADTTKSKRAIPEAEPVDEKEADAVPEEIFRAYDIRGIANEQITKELASRIGQAIGSEALDNNEQTLIVARDARLHSPELMEWLIRGILDSGCNVLNIGTVPTPILYFATETLDDSRSGVMVTASHNPAEYNGFKIVINGVCRSEEDIKAIRARILSRNLHQGKGTESHRDIVPNYIDTIFSDVALAGDVSIVLDAANGVTGLVAPRLFEALGCYVTPLFCDIDGHFPNHSPDPSVPRNLLALIAKVKEVKADLGVAFDGDGDRLVVVTPKGEIIWPDRLLMLFAKDIVSRNPGCDVVFDVKSTRHLVQTVTSYGGRPIMWKTGHSPMKSKMNETGALLGGEYSGHIFIKDRWYGFDDGLYAAARLIEILTLQGQTLDEVMDEFPCSPSTPEIRVKVEEQNKFKLMQALIKDGDFGDARITSIDGIRADYNFGWGLIRASNTSPNLTMRFEADDDAGLHKLKSIFVKELRKVDHTIKVEWE